MRLLSWLRPRNPLPGPRTRPAFRPRLETMEERWQPSVLTVTNTSDIGGNSLRSEIDGARAGDTIVFDPSLNGQTITLTSGELLIKKDLTIIGPGADMLTVSGNHASRVFFNSGAVVAISGLTIANGDTTSSGGGAIYIEGGGIYNLSGALTVTGCTLSGNAAYIGGGIRNTGGTLTVAGCTLSGNSADVEGGGISNVGTLTVTDCTLSGNSADGNGGGIPNKGPLTVTGCTLSGNSASFDGNGGGIFLYDGPVTVANTILAGNTASDAGQDIFGIVTTSLGHNLVGDGSDSIGFTAAGDQVGTASRPVDPLIGALRDNGGPTQTMALLPRSPAIDAGSNDLAVDPSATRSSTTSAVRVSPASREPRWISEPLNTRRRLSRSAAPAPTRKVQP